MIFETETSLQITITSQSLDPAEFTDHPDEKISTSRPYTGHNYFIGLRFCGTFCVNQRFWWTYNNNNNKK
jgi:hypothetical protein